MRRLVPTFALFVAALCALCASAGAARFYVPSYGSGPPEQITGIELGTDGSLTALSGSPFTGEEAGTGGLWGLAFTPDGAHAASAFLFTGGIQGYSVSPGGNLSLTNALTGASGTGTAITPDGRFAFVPTREFAPPAAKPVEGIARFSVGSNGSLTRLTPSTGTGEAYGIAITPNGRFLYVSEGTKIARFAVGGDGGLSPLGTTEGPTSPYLGVSPDGRFLFVALDSGFRTLAIGTDGSLTPAGPPLTLGGGGSLSIEYFGIAPDGGHVYLPDSNEDRIYSVAIAADGTPSFAGELAVGNPESASVSPDGRYLVFDKAESPYAIRAAAIGPGGSLNLLPSSVEFSSPEPEPLVFQPQPAPVARFGSTAGAAGTATTFNAGASERAARYEWSFGDGTTVADAGSTPSHTYASPGTYQVTLVVTDAQGCSVQQVYTGQSTVCPGGDAARTTSSVTVPPSAHQNAKPVLGKVKAVPPKFAPKVRGAKPGKVKLGTSFRFTVSEDATVRFKFERKQGKRFKKLGSRSKKAKKGAGKLKWNGKLHGKPLRPGRYRATVVATDAEGARSAPKKVGFRILPVPPLR